MTQTTSDSGWQSAGEAWGARARDWACLGEPAARDAYRAVFDSAAVGPDTHVLDIACGAGLALVLASARGASVAGLDASEQLLRVAAARLPTADLRNGDMATLPWPDDTFDVATAFNGIWSGNQDALNEAARVVRPGGRVAVMFFASGGRAEHLAPVIAFATLMPPTDAQGGGIDLLGITQPGAAEAMFEAAGIAPISRLRTQGTSEWPDFDLAWRAAAATGPAWSALQHCREEAARDAVREALQPYYQDNVGYRLTSDYEYVLGVVR